MRVNINLPEELVKIIDLKAKALYLSRSGFIASVMSQKIDADELLQRLPELQELVKQYMVAQAKDDQTKLD